MRTVARFLLILIPAFLVVFAATGLSGSSAPTVGQDIASVATSLWALGLCNAILLTFVVLAFVGASEPSKADRVAMIGISLIAALATIFISATMPGQRTMLSMVFAGGVMILLTQMQVRRSSPAYL